MLKEKAFDKRFVRTGPGGIHCGCCFPQESKAKKSELRRFRKAEKRFIQAFIKEALE